MGRKGKSLKHSLEELKNHFSSNEWPTFESLNIEPDSLQLNITVGPEVQWFEGHFPEQPVLAGVVQTHWVGELSAYLFELKGGFSSVQNLKFQTVILPEAKITLGLSFDPDKSLVKFKYYDENHSYSEGKMTFTAA